jgi:hypothetical protein
MSPGKLRLFLPKQAGNPEEALPQSGSENETVGILLFPLSARGG